MLSLNQFSVLKYKDTSIRPLFFKFLCHKNMSLASTELSGSHIFPRLCNHHYYLSQNVFITPERNPLFISSPSSFLPSPSPWQPLISSLSLVLPVLGILHRWSNLLLWTLCLVSINEHVFRVHLCGDMYQKLHLFFKLNNIPSFVCSPVTVLLGGFYFLTTMNSTPGNLDRGACVDVYFQFFCFYLQCLWLFTGSCTGKTCMLSLIHSQQFLFLLGAYLDK